MASYCYSFRGKYVFLCLTSQSEYLLFSLLKTKIRLVSLLHLSTDSFDLVTCAHFGALVEEVLLHSDSITRHSCLCLIFMF